jgi:Mlc titration factor MtfA (ptsG expression regulator)
MLRRWLDAWQQRRMQRVLTQRAIPDDLWLDTLRAYPFLIRRPLPDLLRLRELATLFLTQKEFSTAEGLSLTDAMAVAVAAQACVPVLHLPGGLGLYGGFVGIVLHPQEVVVQRQWSDEAGVVHSGEEVLAGEAMDGGPLMLSWQDVQLAGAPERTEDGYNVVIHEFVHVLDMHHGGVDGVPALSDRAMQARWTTVMAHALAQHNAEVDAETPTWLDPYAAQGPEEFFPVTAEAFFVAPEGLQAEFPEVYTLLSAYFGQDPVRFQA